MIRNTRWWLGTLALAVAAMVQALPARAADDLTKYLPDKTEFIVHMNIRQLIESPLAKKDVQAKIDEAKKDEHAKQIMDALGFDPSKDLHGITLAGPVSIEAREKGIAVITGNFDVDKFQKVAQHVAKEHGDNLKITKNGAYTVWEVSGLPNVPSEFPETLYIALVDKNTMLITGGKDVLGEALQKAAGKKKTELNKDLTGWLAKDYRKQSMWAVVQAEAIGNSDLPNAEAIKTPLQKFVTLSGGVTLTNDLKILVALGTKNARSAQQIGKQIKEGLDAAPFMVKIAAKQNEQIAPFADLITEFVKTLKTDVKGTSVLIESTLSKEQLDKLEKEGKKAKKGSDQ